METLQWNSLNMQNFGLRHDTMFLPSPNYNINNNIDNNNNNNNIKQQSPQIQQFQQ